MAKKTTKGILSLTPLERLCKKAGAKRVSKGATLALAHTLEEIAVEICLRAIKLAKHAGRKTVKMEDIELAREEIWG